MTSAELAVVPEPAEVADPPAWIYRRPSRRFDALRLFASLTTEGIGFLTGGRVYLDAGVRARPGMRSIDV
jgi:hypothetical protein